MKKKLLTIIPALCLFANVLYSQIMQASLGAGSKTNRVKIYIKPSVTLADANISTLQFDLGINESISPKPTAAVITEAFGATWTINTATESGYYHFKISTGKSPLNFATTANTEIEAMEVEFTGGPIAAADVSLVSLPDGGSNGDAFFYCTSTNINSDGSNLYYARSGVTVDNKLSYDLVGGNPGTGISTATITGILLPVNWLSFTASLKGSGAELNWSAEEKNSKNFEITRSLDGVKFTTINQVASKGNGTNSYTYTDEAVTKIKTEGDIFYQLIQVDKDGKRNPSAVRTVRISLPVGGISVSPNPVVNIAIVRFNHPKEEKATLRITDVNGKVVYQQATQLQKGYNQKEINLSAFSKGNYSLSVVSGSANKTIQLVKAGQ